MRVTDDMQTMEVGNDELRDLRTFAASCARWIKARDDIRQVLESQSWQPFEVRPGENKGYFDKLVCVGRTLADWHRLERTVRCGDVVLVQFPLIMYNKVSLYALPSVRRMKARGALFVFLIHDLKRYAATPTPISTNNG